MTHGEGVLFHHFREYGPYTGEMQGRKNGGMIAMSTDKAVAYALTHAATARPPVREAGRRVL